MRLIRGLAEFVVLLAIIGVSLRLGQQWGWRGERQKFADASTPWWVMREASGEGRRCYVFDVSLCGDRFDAAWKRGWFVVKLYGQLAPKKLGLPPPGLE